MKREWKNTEQDCDYYYSTDDGRIVGQVHNIVHTKIWVSKIIMNHNEEKYLGQYITREFSRKSVEQYWNIQDATFIEYEPNEKR